MRTPWIWSISLGRWWNVHLRLHMFFVLFTVLAFHLMSHSFVWQLQLGFLLTLFVSILVHEVAHVTLARRLGGVADEIVLGPLGALSSARVPYEPQSELVVLFGGLVASTAICVTAGLGLLLLEPRLELQRLLNPLELSGIDPGQASGLALLRLVFCVNWTLILVNLIPAYPFDAGRMLQCVLSLMWPESNVRQTRITTCRISQLISIVLLIWASYVMTTPMLVLGGLDALGLMLLATFVFFSAHRERLQQTEVEQDEDTLFGYDFSQGYTSLERDLDEGEDEEETTTHVPRPMGLFGQWLENRREAQRVRQLEQERDDERRVDEILSRLHEHGMRSLSHEDRLLLERVSRRYRSRQD